ncbi:MAG: hypothetical protein HYT10_02470 [Candidatus Levybacteria bacterium]|nr:hypothetical protein [Candidatus Levybacteria bacterium]
MAQSKDLIATVEDIYAKAPALPANIREIIVKITPWLALIFGILGIIGGLGAVGLSPLAGFAGVQVGMSVLVSGVLTIIYSILLLMAFPKVQKNQLAGWNLLFWSEVVSIVSSLVLVNIISAIVGALIGFYILFQIKSYYK